MEHGLAELADAAAPLLFLAGLRRIGATRTAVLSLSEPRAATLLAAVMLGQLPEPAQLLGAALLVGAGIAIQIVPVHPVPPGCHRRHLLPISGLFPDAQPGNALTIVVACPGGCYSLDVSS